MTLFVHISRHELLAKMILRGTVEGRTKRNWTDDILNRSNPRLSELLNRLPIVKNGGSCVRHYRAIPLRDIIAGLSDK